MRPDQPGPCRLLRYRRLLHGPFGQSGDATAGDLACGHGIGRCDRYRGRPDQLAGPGRFSAIVTMGVGFLFVGIVRQQDVLGGEMGISAIPSHGMEKTSYLLLVLALVILVMAWNLFIKKSWMGFAFDAVADDEDTARLLSIDVAAYKLAAFAMGTALAGLAGGLYVYFARFIVPDDFGFITSISILSMVAVGGIGSVFGVLASTIILTLMPEFFRFVSDYKLLIYGSLLFFVMRFFPEGLAGLTRRLLSRFNRTGIK